MFQKFKRWHETSESIPVSDLEQSSLLFSTEISKFKFSFTELYTFKRELRYEIV